MIWCQKTEVFVLCMLTSLAICLYDGQTNIDVSQGFQFATMPVVKLPF